MVVEYSSMINLTCVISWTSSSWYHNHTKLKFRGPRPGVSLIVDKSDVTTVSLLRQLAQIKDSGVYSCKSENAPEANITLHVLKGSNSPQMHLFISICRPPLNHRKIGISKILKIQRKMAIFIFIVIYFKINCFLVSGEET